MKLKNSVIPNSWTLRSIFLWTVPTKYEWIISNKGFGHYNQFLNVLHVHSDNIFYVGLDGACGALNCKKQLPKDLYFIAQMLLENFPVA